MASLLKCRRTWALAFVALAVLWYPAAYPRGMAPACLDRLLGRREVKTFGVSHTLFRSEYARLLADRYGVRLQVVAGVNVPCHVRWYAEGYNAVSKELVNREFGRDVFAECVRVMEQEAGD